MGFVTLAASTISKNGRIVLTSAQNTASAIPKNRGVSSETVGLLAEYLTSAEKDNVQNARYSDDSWKASAPLTAKTFLYKPSTKNRSDPKLSFVRRSFSTSAPISDEKPQEFDFDFFVIGAGSGGIASARRAASTWNKKVAVAEVAITVCIAATASTTS